jgi:hypothetical protein
MHSVVDSECAQRQTRAPRVLSDRRARALVYASGDAANAQASRGFKVLGINHISYQCPDWPGQCLQPSNAPFSKCWPVLGPRGYPQALLVAHEFDRAMLAKLGQRVARRLTAGAGSGWRALGRRPDQERRLSAYPR